MSDARLPFAICIMGPTASGKTDLAVELCRELPCEIISVDSALIYRGMDIGTAKPEPEVLAQAPHRLIDIIDVDESYSVARFYDDALREMNDIVSRGNIPLLVGGTMMYYRIIQNGIASMPSADENVRAQISADAEQNGWPAVHEKLAKVDPEAAVRIKPTDPQRLQRALEVYLVTGKTMSEHWKRQRLDEDARQDTKEGVVQEGGLPPVPFNFLNFSISPEERSQLHERIALRFRMMVEAGFIEEVEGFYHSGRVTSDMPSMRCVGYRQAWDYLDGRLNKDEMIERGIIATRQLAKRQLTWLRSWPKLHQLQTNDTKVLAKVMKIVENARY